MKNQSGPMLDAGLSGADRPTSTSAACSTRRWWSPSASSAAARSRASAPRGNGNSADGRDHWPYCYTAVVAGAGIKRGYVHGKSRQDRLAPRRRTRSTPASCWRRSTTRFGIDPDTIVYNHLNQPRELVKAEAVSRLFS